MTIHDPVLLFLAMSIKDQPCLYRSGNVSELGKMPGFEAFHLFVSTGHITETKCY